MPRFDGKSYQPRTDGDGGYWRDVSERFFFYTNNAQGTKVETQGRALQWIPFEPEETT